MQQLQTNTLVCIRTHANTSICAHQQHAYMQIQGAPALTQTSNMPTCRHFGSKVKLWATFNEPGVMGFCGWIYGTFPPAKTLQWATAGRHVGSMLCAHTAAYQAIKAMPGVVIN